MDVEKSTKKSKAKAAVLVVIIVVGFIVATAVGISLYYAKDDMPTSTETIYTRNKPLIGCPVEANTSSKCHDIEGCMWFPTSNPRAPKCIYKENVGYRLQAPVGVSADGRIHTAILLRTGMTSLYGMPLYDSVNVTVDTYNEKALRVYIRPQTSVSHWEISDELLKMNKQVPKAGIPSEYTVEFHEDPIFGIVIKRNSTGTTLFNSTLPGLILTEQFLQISTHLPSSYLYGFGEHNHRRFQHDLNWRTWPIFTRDMHPEEHDLNLYGAHPVHMSLENDGKASLVFLKNSHAMDVTLQPDPYPALTYKVVGGVLDFYIFTGPTPKEAVQQYLQAVGLPPMPPYWALGFHLCRWGYGNLTNLKTVYQRNSDAGIPQDVQWADIDYMYNKYMFTYDKTTFSGLPEFVNELHQAGQKFVVILDPGIGSDPQIIPGALQNSPGYDVYADGIDQGVLVKNADSDDPLVGKVWPGLTVFPDFTHPNATAFWTKWIQYFLNNESVAVDGLWIDMNEPASFVPGSTSGCQRNKLNNPPYVPPIYEGEKDGGSLYYKTICMDSRHNIGSHYQVHSLYGHSEAIVTRSALLNIFDKKRPFILTRSSFAGTGHYSFKWMGDNTSKWSHMHWSIIGILEFGIFGFTMNGADICGFFENAEREMCIRWFQLGAFYPFSRSHNIQDATDQDPAAWDDHFIQIVKQSLLTRYTLLPYYYTVFKEAHISGATVMRSLLFEFPEDKNTWSIDKQFLIGASLLVSPVLEEGKREVKAYFPRGRWFLYHDGSEITEEESRQYLSLSAPLDTINVHIRGGSILPVQKPANTTKYSRLNPMGLLVAMDKDVASGELFFDDGESIDSLTRNEYLRATYKLSKGEKLDLIVDHVGYTPPGNLTYEYIDFYGFRTLPRQVTVDGNDIPITQLQWNIKIARLTGLQLDITTNHTVQWKFY